MGTTAKGQPDGLATLDSDGDVPVTQIPSEVALDADLGELGLADSVDYEAAIGALTTSAAAALTATAPAALTASAPAAQTSVAPASLTSAQLTGGESPTEGEHNQLQADVAEIRTQVVAAVADITELRTKLAAAIVDLPAVRTPLAAAIVDLAELRTKLNAGVTDLGTIRTKVNNILAELVEATVMDAS